MTPLAYTVAEVAAALKISRQAVYRLVREGTIPSRRYGRSVRVPAWWLEEEVKRAA